MTAKGRLKSTDMPGTFRLHLWWSVATALALGAAVATDQAALTMRIALTVPLGAGADASYLVDNAREIDEA
ncbi:hypothetical protein GCM10022403_087710 [Streptomyces coacervatus]|uniref:Uncharacterized protein n=1 Tax=Streptomyces coacervatus TaxID=647381 RepID=A0ABP7JD70_9ACTN